jgi:hypothetical protein
MLSQLLAFPVRALVVVALFPTPPAFGAALMHQSALAAPAIIAPSMDAGAVSPAASAPTFHPVPILGPLAGPAGR